MRPTTKTKREREHAPSNNTHTHTKSFTFKTKSELFSASDGGLEPTAAKQKKQCRSSPREKRMIISSIINTKNEREIVSNHQHKERERGREYGRQATTHTQSRSSPQLNEGQNPVGWLKPHNLKHTKNHHVPRGKKNDHTIRLLKQNTKKES